MWRVHRDAGRPWPTISDDPVIDYMVMEAVALRVREEDRAAEKKRERDEWKKQTGHLKS
jgi:hypothetical protein